MRLRQHLQMAGNIRLRTARRFDQGIDVFLSRKQRMHQSQAGRLREDRKPSRNELQGVIG